MELVTDALEVKNSSRRAFVNFFMNNLKLEHWWA
jgi:hypothetical protein